MAVPEGLKFFFWTTRGPEVNTGITANGYERSVGGRCCWSHLPARAPPGRSTPGWAASRWPAAASRGSCASPPGLPPRLAFPSGFRYLFPPPPPRRAFSCSLVRFSTRCLLLAPRWRWRASTSTPCSRHSPPRRRAGAVERLSYGRVRRPPSGRPRAARWWVAAGGGSPRRLSRRPCRRRGRKWPARPAPRGPPRRPPSWSSSLGEPAALVRQRYPCSMFQH